MSVRQLVENCIGKGGNSRNNSLIYALGNVPIVLLYKYIINDSATLLGFC